VQILLRIMLLLGAGLLAPAQAADCHMAQEAYAAGDYSEALVQWQALADQGHAHSQLMIGSLYFNGKGVAQDYAEAERWFVQAASNGSADAALQLAEMYANGVGVTQDARQSKRWSARAGELAQNDSIECHSVPKKEGD
jgi:uncharacterized protein